MPDTYYASPALCYEINFTWTFLCQQKRNIESKVWSQFQPILDLLNTETKTPWKNVLIRNFLSTKISKTKVNCEVNYKNLFTIFKMPFNQGWLGSVKNYQNLIKMTSNMMFLIPQNTPPRTPRTSGLKSQILKPTFLS